MFKIGLFSKLSKVPIKTLRYYDKRELLKPSVIDKASGYRYYTAEQLLTIQRIVDLKKQGFTLEEIKILLAEDVLFDDVKKSLTKKQRELQHIIEETQRQLKEIHSGLERIDNLGNLSVSVDSMVIRNVKSQLVASVRDTIPRTNLCLLLDEIRQYVHVHGEDENQSLHIQWHNSRLEEDTIDIEVALPITKEIPSSDRVNIYFWPELKQAVSLVHRCDPYHSSCSALSNQGLSKLTELLSSNGYRPNDTEPIREIYLTADRDVYGKLRMAELLIPVETM